MSVAALARSSRPRPSALRAEGRWPVPAQERASACSCPWQPNASPAEPSLAPPFAGIGATRLGLHGQRGGRRRPARAGIVTSARFSADGRFSCPSPKKQPSISVRSVLALRCPVTVQPRRLCSMQGLQVQLQVQLPGLLFHIQLRRLHRQLLEHLRRLLP